MLEDTKKPFVHAGGVVTIAEGKHPFPSRTRPLSLPAPMILWGQPHGKIGRCHSTRLHRRVFCWGYFASDEEVRLANLFFNCSFSSVIFFSSVAFKNGSPSHQLIPIAFALSTEAISSLILLVRSSTSTRSILMSPTITTPLSSTRSKRSAKFVACRLVLCAAIDTSLPIMLCSN